MARFINTNASCNYTITVVTSDNIGANKTNLQHDYEQAQGIKLFSCSTELRGSVKITES